MARRHQITVILAWVDGSADGVGAIGRRDARGNPVLGFDRHGERRTHAGAVRARHRFEPQRIRALFGQREADEAPPVPRHEVDSVGRRHLCRDHEIAFVLAVLRVDQHDHPSVAQILDDFVG